MKRHIFLALFSFFFNVTTTTEIYTLSLHDALPIFAVRREGERPAEGGDDFLATGDDQLLGIVDRSHPQCAFLRRREETETRSEEHTSELQSRLHLVCRLLLEKINYLLRSHTKLCQS